MKCINSLNHFCEHCTVILDECPNDIYNIGTKSAEILRRIKQISFHMQLKNHLKPLSKPDAFGANEDNKI